jgi:hypothetical protein
VALYQRTCPPAEDAKKVERRLAIEEKKALENKNNKGRNKRNNHSLYIQANSQTVSST